MPKIKKLALGLSDDQEVYTVSALNREVRRAIESGLGTAWVQGEISNLARPSSGHIYFSLKDADAQVRCAMFRQASRRLGFTVADGTEVLVRARVSLYEPRGDYQLIVDHMEQAGEGALRQRFEALRAKLADEGLFDNERKRPLPGLPARIGVITSPSGAALRDVLVSLRRRFPAAGVLIYPTSVQGDKAAPEIVAALDRAATRNECDVLILTRGGGSLEDLWPFNEEAVARAVAASPIPTVVAVGHETDFTIAEFAADLRAPTPSQAAELAVPQATDYLDRAARISTDMARALLRLLQDAGRRLDGLEHRLGRTHPGYVLGAKAERLGALIHRLRRAHPGRILASREQRLASGRDRLQRVLKARLEGLTARLRLTERSLAALSPTATLERGYAIVCRADDGSLVTMSENVQAGSEIEVRLARGELTATVDSTRNDDT